MIPVLLNAPFLKIYTFGLFLVLGLYWGLFWFWKVVKLTSYKEETMFDGVFISLFGGLVMSRLVYVFVHFDSFGFDFLKYILVNGYPGGSLYGFLLGFFVTFYLFCKVENISFKHSVDYLVGPLLLAFAIIKVGSFFAGVDPGSKTSFFLATKYSGYAGMRHITPLYEAFILFGSFWLAHKLIFAIRRDQLPEGYLLWVLLSIQSIMYVTLDLLKENHLYLGQFNINWLLSIPILSATIIYYIYTSRVALKEIGLGVRKKIEFYAKTRQSNTTTTKK